MASGGEPEYIEMDDPRQPLLPKTTDTTTETSFSKTVFEDDNTRLLTDETSNLIDGETTVPFSGEGIPLGGATVGGATDLKMIYIPNLEGYINVTYEEINNALISSRKGKNIKGFGPTDEGIANMTNHVYKKDGYFYLVVKGVYTKLRGYRLTYKEKGNKIIKFYNYKRFNNAYGKDIAELLKLLFTNPTGFNEKYENMGWAHFGDISEIYGG